MQAAKILRAAGDNLYERLKGQSASRQILKHSVAVMESRLSIRFPCASLRPLLYPIIQSIVVERNIAGKKYKSSEILGNSETRSQICSENRSQLGEGDILSLERSPRGNAFSGHPERSERAQHDSIL